MLFVIKATWILRHTISCQRLCAKDGTKSGCVDNQNMTVTNMPRDLILQHANSDMFTDDGRCEWDCEEIEKKRGTRG